MRYSAAVNTVFQIVNLSSTHNPVDKLCKCCDMRNYVKNDFFTVFDHVVGKGGAVPRPVLVTYFVPG